MQVQNNKGFTLIELIVVVTIMAVLAAVAIPSYNTIQDRAKKSLALSNAQTIASAANVHNALSISDNDITVDSVQACTTDEAFNAICTQSPVSISDAELQVAVGYLIAEKNQDDTDDKYSFIVNTDDINLNS